jgi:membrane-associated phospholipid phosphatase
MSTRTAWIWAGVLVISAALFWKAWDAVTELGTTVRADRSLVDFVVDHRSAWLTDVARAWTLLGSAWVVAPVVTIAVVVLVTRHRLPAAVVVAASSVGSALAVTTVKASVARPRPPVGGHLVSALGTAFPSGHAAQSVACYSALTWAVTTQVASRSTRIMAWTGATLIALGVGWSRVYLGVHWPSDVLGGWTLAAGWLAALVLADLFRSTRRDGEARGVA